MALDDAQLCRRLAEGAGQQLVAARSGLFARFVDLADVKDAADALAQNFIAAALREHRPHDAVLSEEAPDDYARLDARRVWIIDPLDGTREYARSGRADWAVHVALWEADTDRLTAAAVALPAQAIMLDTATTGPPQWPALVADRPLRVVVSESRRPKVLDALMQRLHLDVITWGSAGAKAARVILGDVDCYLHDSALNEWDAAAPVAVAQAAGLHVSALDGSALRFNQRDTVSGSLLMCRPDAADMILSALAADGGEGR